MSTIAIAKTLRKSLRFCMGGARALLSHSGARPAYSRSRAGLLAWAIDALRDTRRGATPHRTSHPAAVPSPAPLRAWLRARIRCAENEARPGVRCRIAIAPLAINAHAAERSGKTRAPETETPAHRTKGARNEQRLKPRTSSSGSASLRAAQIQRSDEQPARNQARQ
jgi:hypothetical protein